jgi:hypothetical protein
MATMKTLKFSANPATKDGAFWSTKYELFNNFERFEFVIEAETASEMYNKAVDHLKAMTLDPKYDGYTAHASTVNGARWPNGFKARFCSRAMVVDCRETV